MSVATAKLSVEASDVQTDEDCDELVEDGFAFSADVSEKIRAQRTRSKSSSGKPPPSPRSPYLSSMNVNPRRVAVAAWRLPRASLGNTAGNVSGESSLARLTSLSNGHNVSQTMSSESESTPEFLKQTFSMRKHKHLHAGSNGFSFSAGDYKEKEDMYDEIIHLKKSLQAQKLDNQQMKVKLRRLEEDNAKREKQIEELLDPTKGSDYTRSLVDKKRREGSVVLNGLKQRILKLEQQCREKETALSKLQSELRTTNLEELKITVEAYFQEIQRLKILLEAAEKSSRAESKCSQRQQKALNSTVHRLSRKVKQLQQENSELREELNTDSPAGGIKGYREWSKQRLLRRLLEVETRLEDSRRHAQMVKSSRRLDREVQTIPSEIQGFTTATVAVVSVGMMTEEVEEVSGLKERLSQLEEARAEFQQMLSNKDDELRQLRKERQQFEKETDQWKEEQTKERDTERQQYEEELEHLRMRIKTLIEREPGQTEPSSLPEDAEDTRARAGLEEGGERDAGGAEQKGGDEGLDTGKRERERATSVIQRTWREHRERDMVMLQSALRGHLVRESQLKELLKDTHKKAVAAVINSSVEQDAVALTMIQSAFRGHLARCSLARESSGVSMPTLAPRRACTAHPGSRTGAASLHKDNFKEGGEECQLTSSTQSSRKTPNTDQVERHGTAARAEVVDSDDSDDIIVSPSRHLRSREILIL